PVPEPSTAQTGNVGEAPRRKLYADGQSPGWPAASGRPVQRTHPRFPLALFPTPLARYPPPLPPTPSAAPHTGLQHSSSPRSTPTPPIAAGPPSRSPSTATHPAIPTTLVPSTPATAAAVPAATHLLPASRQAPPPHSPPSALLPAH